MTAPRDDWRRQGQEKYLRGLEFSPHRYAEAADPLAHDHREFCYRKFSHAPGDLREGYATPDLSRWVCPRCHAEFEEEFGWASRGAAGEAAGRP